MKILALAVLVPAIAAAAPDGAKIEAATGLKGTLNEAEGVFKVSVARTDIKVDVDGRAIASK